MKVFVSSLIGGMEKFREAAVDAIEALGQTPNSAQLHPVKDRSGNIIPAPSGHDGKPMKADPHEAADLGLQWLAALVATAEAMDKTE